MEMFAGVRTFHYLLKDRMRPGKSSLKTAFSLAFALAFHYLCTRTLPDKLLGICPITYKN